jgi:hypothetical protein
MALITRTVGAYTISDDPARLDFHAMHAYLRRSYWSQDIRYMERVDPKVYKR